MTQTEETNTFNFNADIRELKWTGTTKLLLRVNRLNI